MATRRDFLSSLAALLTSAALPSALGAPVVAIEMLTADGLRMGEGTFLVIGQTESRLNGVYRATAGTWERCGDANPVGAS